MRDSIKLTYIQDRIYSSLSILLSVVSLIVIIRINMDMSIHYQTLDGKTQLLLGLTQFVGFYFKFYVGLVLSLIAAGLSFIGYKKKENVSANKAARILSLLSLIAVAYNIGRFMI